LPGGVRGGVRAGCSGWGFAVDVDASVVAARGEERAVTGVCPGYAPYCAFVAERGVLEGCVWSGGV
jgi:hypothetical protein